MKRLIVAVLSVLMVLSGLSFAVTPAIVAADSQITISYPDTTVSGGFQAGNFADVWDLTSGDLVLTFTVDLNGMEDQFVGDIAHAWSEFGIRAVGYGNFNPTWHVEGAGVWLATDYDWAANGLGPDVGAPTQDIDDKLMLQRGGGCGEGGYGVTGTGYNLPGVPPAPGNNHRIWFDRDGVDPWQNPATANTGGIYHIVMTLHATSATAGTAYMTINGLAQGFETDGNWNTIELTPAGMTFAGNMKQMQVFYGIYGYGATHSAAYNDISVTGYPCVITVTANAQTKVYGQADPALTYTCDTPGVTFTGALSRDSGENVGTYAINQGDLSATGYTITYTAGTLTVTPAALNIKADDKSKDYGAALPTLTVTYTGLVNGDTAPATVPTIGTTATASSPVGTYPITATGAADPNYTITYTDGTLTVNKASTTVALISSDNPSYFLQRVTFTATVTAVAPGAGTPTGTITFKDGTTTLGTATLDSAGKATYRTHCLRSLCLGSHSITAVYSGDASFTTSTSPVLTQTVLSWLKWLLYSLGH